VACFTADAVQMPPNAPANVGAENIRAWSGGMLAAFGVKFALSPEEVQPAGPEWAFERGTYTITLTPKTGDEPVRTASRRHLANGPRHLEQQ
jgi:ketosteroid isomerase-like protein